MHRFAIVLVSASSAAAVMLTDCGAAFHQPEVQAQSNTRNPGSSTRQPPMRQRQGSTTRQQGSTVRQGTTTIQQHQPFEQRLWNHLQAGRYQYWAPVPGRSDEMYKGESPHGAFLKMYLNRTAAGNSRSLPAGSIVVKENYGPDRKTLMAITVMYRTQNYSPEAGNWYWVKYRPDGSVDTKATPNGMMKLAGRVNGCVECHSGADGGDLAFLNDGR